MKPMNGIVRTGERGFTLLEILVAVSLIATALLVIIQLFSANLRGISAAENYSHAVIKAEEAMREALDKKDLTEGTWSELKENRYRVDVRVREIAEKRTENIPFRLYGVSLTLRWAEGTKMRTITLASIKLVERKI